MVETKTLLFVGGSFGGLTSLKYFVKEFISINKSDIEVKIYLIEPRAGFLNVLGIPKALLSAEFAKEIYLNTENFNLEFETVESNDVEFKEKVLNLKSNQVLPKNLHLHLIHGKCIKYLNSNEVQYKVNEDDELKNLKFHYSAFSTGRSRPWPMDPVGFNEEGYVKEVEKFLPKIEEAKIISIVGGGALGIEVAGEIKESYPDKVVNLIHPHDHVPPEKFASNNLIINLKKHILEMEINLILNTRIEKELENKDLLTTSGDTIESELNIWCNSHTNNIEPLLPVFKDSIDSKNEVIVDTNMLMKDQDNIFVIGDVTNFPIIKTAGGAFRQGEKVGQSLINIVVKDELVYDRIDLEEWPKGMTIVVGNHRSVTQWDIVSENGNGKVVINDPDVLNFYADYCTANTRLNLNINK